MAILLDRHGQNILVNQKGTSLVQNLAMLAVIAVVIFFMMQNKIKKQIATLESQKQTLREEIEYKLSEVLKYEDQCGNLVLENLQGKILSHKKQQTTQENIYVLNEIKNFQNETVVKSKKLYQKFFRVNSLFLELILEERNELMLYEYRAQAKVIIEFESCQSPLMNCSEQERIFEKKEFPIAAMSIDVNEKGKIFDVVCYRSEEPAQKPETPLDRDIASGN